ncbi:hypothetical protein ABQZ69_14650 [Xanthomonas sp. WHRI 8391]|uniref:hypothetical protein n=1 Tax=Xanthomonas TaxID=338 RepID=UPI0012603172|nr:hypothetical protein [Xanthomonas hortorum]MBG3849377.1 hypothetical protein [Xanthomonas hortorum pv. carotae]UTS71978.1 hypothetical protein NMB96_15820 [Xanthomonas hortorum]
MLVFIEAIIVKGWCGHSSISEVTSYQSIVSGNWRCKNIGIGLTASGGGQSDEFTKFLVVVEE